MACTRLLHGYFYRSQGSWYAYSELESMPESVSTHALSQVSLAAAAGARAGGADLTGVRPTVHLGIKVKGAGF